MRGYWAFRVLRYMSLCFPDIVRAVRYKGERFTCLAILTWSCFTPILGVISLWIKESRYPDFGSCFTLISEVGCPNFGNCLLWVRELFCPDFRSCFALISGVVFLAFRSCLMVCFRKASGIGRLQPLEKKSQAADWGNGWCESSLTRCRGETGKGKIFFFTWLPHSKVVLASAAMNKYMFMSNELHRYLTSTCLCLMSCIGI